MVEPHRVGRPGVRHDGGRRRGLRGAAHRPVPPRGRRGHPTRPAAGHALLDGALPRPGERRPPLAARRAQRADGRDHPSEELVRLGHAGDRRRAGLRALRQPWTLRVRPRRSPRLVARHRVPPRSMGLGGRFVAGPARRPGARDARQRRGLVSGVVRCDHRRAALADAARRGQRVVDAVRLAERPAHRDRNGGEDPRPLLRPGGQPPLVVLGGHDQRNGADPGPGATA